LMGTIVVPLFAHYRSPNPPVQAALAGGLRGYDRSRIISGTHSLQRQGAVRWL
jgi:hypothetical protein